MKALQVFAGPRARERLRERGLVADDVRVIPGAAGGPKGLVLNPLDRFLFGEWLPKSSHTVHLVGASIGAWRLAVACKPDPDAALAELAEEYIAQTFERAPGKAPAARHVSEVFARTIEKRLVAFAEHVLQHPRYRLHVFTSRGRHVLGRQGRVRTPVGYLGAFMANAASRRALGSWLERVVFADPREALPFRCTTSAAGASTWRPRTSGRRSWPAARSRSCWRRCTTSPAHRAAPTGTAASPTTTCTWTTPR